MSSSDVEKRIIIYLKYPDIFWKFVHLLNVPILVSFMVEYPEVSIWGVKKFWKVVSLLEIGVDLSFVWRQGQTCR